MRVIPLTSILSHKGRGSPNRDDTLSLEIKELFKHALGVAIPGCPGNNRHPNLLPQFRESTPDWPPNGIERRR